MFKIFSGLIDSNEKELKRIQPLVDKINALETDFRDLSDDALRAKTDEFEARLNEATAVPRERAEERKAELEGAKVLLNQAQNDFEREEQDAHVKRLQEAVAELETELRQAEDKALHELLPEAFAAVREAARRTIRQRHFDVQLIGGIVLHQGKIAEMKTGEGKTLSATLPLYLNALAGRGCHLVTVNDYLAKRDPYWMGPIYHALGVSVASIYGQTPDNQAPSFIYDPAYDSGDKHWQHLRPITRKEAYAADITYGTNNEFGFDYLRDNMVIDLAQCVQRTLHYAIVDEVDNLLIDEARTPLIISGHAEEAGPRYQMFARLVSRLQPETDYVVEEKHRTVNLTENGTLTIENALKRDNLLRSPNLYDTANYALTRYLDAALKAHALYRRDRDYVVKDGQVIIVDEFTGRLMFGRRYSEGLHQAIEAKESVKVQRESLTYATITFQNYFRMYRKLAGMTGTALTEAEEFHKIYKLEVVVIPTNKPMIREDFTDQIYKNEKAKFNAVVREVEEMHKQERPVLIGTTSIEKSEYLSELMKRKGIPHQVLNAKLHEKEAGIIAQAGRAGTVTVATNMAGRGVDIILGGSPEGQSHEEWQKAHGLVVARGGLHIVGTERHEARRIDNQLRGRTGRQGDPGSSRFYVSLEDDIMRRFGGDQVKRVMEWAGLDEETPIENKMVNRIIENAQIRTEGYHFDTRKHLVEYDDVVNKHREVIYGERRKILSGADLKANILTMIEAEVIHVLGTHLAGDRDTEPDFAGLLKDAGSIFPVPREVAPEALAGIKPKEIEAKLIELARAQYDEHEKKMGAENMRLLERLVMLRTIDNLWVEHLTAMEDMRLGIGLEAAGQRDPLIAYKNRGHELFQNLLETIQHDVVHSIYHLEIKKEEPPPKAESRMAQAAGRSGVNRLPVGAGSHKVGRNDPCPCGSGKKYKHCHGR
ncbi:MAG: preprotein translocase subunit SecA [Chloroflexi bacterium]|nr:preprotein translocase subunit SecA [Chloroflexota bacterium]